MERNIIKRMRGNLTQKELAELIGLSQQAIAMYESNLREPKKEILEKIAKATGYKLIFTVEKIETETENKQ